MCLRRPVTSASPLAAQAGKHFGQLVLEVVPLQRVGHHVKQEFVLIDLELLA
jgi:hypothetical protein